MDDKYKYVVFSPYFGKLPNSFNLWLESCSNNTDFKFVVFTDDKRRYDAPRNVEIIRLSFNDFRAMVQNKFQFKIALNNPYKLCDFKPTWGYVFSDYIRGCDYWGHCDLDLILGDIKKFFPKKPYDKISYLGHLCLYKNNKQVNTMFMKTPKDAISYADILSHNQHFGFDEIGNYGINSIFEKNNLTISNFNLDGADIDCKKKGLFLVELIDGKFLRSNKEKLFVYKNGGVFSFDLSERRMEREYAYVHFQKRRMSNSVRNVKKFIIAFDGFVDYTQSKKNFSRLSSNGRVNLRWIKFDVLAVYKRMKRMITVRRIHRRNSA